MAKSQQTRAAKAARRAKRKARAERRATPRPNLTSVEVMSADEALRRVLPRPGDIGGMWLIDPDTGEDITIEWGTEQQSEVEKHG